VIGGSSSVSGAALDLFGVLSRVQTKKCTGTLCLPGLSCLFASTSILGRADYLLFLFSQLFLSLYFSATFAVLQDAKAKQFLFRRVFLLQYIAKCNKKNKNETLTS